jgi:hypothetical protein
MNAVRFARLVAWIGAAFWLVFGLWAFLDPTSFAEQLATFPPYNEHLLHDIGAFEVGLGACLLLALFGWSALSATLGGTGAGSVLHAIAHITDRDQGGRDADPFFFTVVAVVTVAAAVMLRQHETRTQR